MCVCATLKENIPNPNHICTYWRESKLSAGNISISSIPEVITHSAPLGVVAYLDSTFIGILPTLEPYITMCT